MFCFFTEIATKIISTERRISDDLIVPKLSPPCSVDFVSKSPKVAPNGRVNTNAIQNKRTSEILVRYLANAIKLPIKIAPPKKPRPESSAKKSPTAVPSVLENRIAVQ